MGPTSRLQAGFRARNWQRFEDNQLCRDEAKVAQVQEAPASQSWLGPSVRGKLKADLTVCSQCQPPLVPDRALGLETWPRAISSVNVEGRDTGG